MSNTVQITGVEFIMFMVERFKMTLSKAMREALDKDQLTPAQRQQRSNIRNAYLIEDWDTIEAGIEQQDDFGKLVLCEMLETCRDQGVTNFGKTRTDWK